MSIMLKLLALMALVFSTLAFAGGDGRKSGGAPVAQTTAPPPVITPPVITQPTPPPLALPPPPIVAVAVPPRQRRCVVVPLGTTVRQTPPVMVPALNPLVVTSCGGTTFVPGLAGGIFAGGETRSTGFTISCFED